MTSLVGSYGVLVMAILFEVAGTSVLNKTEQFTKPLPTFFTLLFYGVAIYLLSIVLKTLPVGSDRVSQRGVASAFAVPSGHSREWISLPQRAG